MAPRTVQQLRCGIAEKQTWEWAASLENQSVSAWLRRLANEEVERAQAEMKAGEDAERERKTMMNLAFPQSLGDSCSHVPQGNYCPHCRGKNW